MMQHLKEKEALCEAGEAVFTVKHMTSQSDAVSDRFEPKLSKKYDVTEVYMTPAVMCKFKKKTKALVSVQDGKRSNGEECLDVYY
jgi:hypothetical protein